MAYRIRKEERPRFVTIIWEADSSATLPSTIESSAGDKCITLDDGAMWLRDGRAWTQVSGDSAAAGSGAQGIQGPPGLDADEEFGWPIPGRQGIDGAAGAQGIQGIQGNPGTNGIIGINGAPGIDGDDPEMVWPLPGPAGAAGTTGGNGTPGSAGVTGPAGIGFPGLDGEDGDMGFPGPAGPAGSAASAPDLNQDLLAPTNDVTLAAGKSAVVVRSYTIALGKKLTIGLGARLRIL